MYNLEEEGQLELAQRINESTAANQRTSKPEAMITLILYGQEHGCEADVRLSYSKTPPTLAIH